MTRRALTRMRILTRSLVRGEAGAVAPLLGVIMLMLIGCMGFAIDVGRSTVVKARLVDALDAAGLAVGSRPATVDYNADALKFVSANFKALYAGATVTSVTATPNSDKSVISLTATATMPTAFMKLFGQPLVTVKAASEVTRAATGLELVLVLDNTGSMEDSKSMPSLKSAANGLVDSLFGKSTTAEDLYIGVVPFSQAVNIGTSASRKTWVKPNTLLAATNPWYPQYWTGCVEERTGTYELSDAAPLLGSANQTFAAYYSPDTTSDVDRGDQANDWIRKDKSPSYVSINYTKYNAHQGPGAYCPQPMTGMTNVKSKITAGINAMTPGGRTMINIGAVWGWRMLSPNWRGYWDGDMAKYSLPLAYGTKNMSKAVVIMTDGENTFTDDYYTAYGYLDDKRLGTNNEGSAVAALDTRLTTVCNSMKAAGIMVITVAYDNPGANIKSLLQRCATNTSLAFDAGSTADLFTKFQFIAGALSNLRVSK